MIEYCYCRDCQGIRQAKPITQTHIYKTGNGEFALYDDSNKRLIDLFPSRYLANKAKLNVRSAPDESS